MSDMNGAFEGVELDGFADDLLGQAARCSQLADTVRDPAAKRALTQMAMEYRARAELLIGKAA